MIMRLKDTPLAIALVVLVASVAYPQPPQTNRGRDVPDFSVQVWSDIVTDFSTRVLSYVALRTELERGLPALTVTGDPAETRRTKQLLAKLKSCCALLIDGVHDVAPQNHLIADNCDHAIDGQ